MENKSYEICKECKKGVHLYEYGFDVKTHICAMCKKDVADVDDFLLSDDLGAEVLSK